MLGIISYFIILCDSEVVRAGLFLILLFCATRSWCGLVYFSPNPKPESLNPKPQTLNPEPGATPR